MNFTPNKNYVLVEIDKTAQKAKQEKTKSGIFLSPKYVFMKYNLQYGDVIAIGANVKKRFPQIEVGDIAIFNHKVEEVGSNLYVRTLDNGNEWRLVPDNEDLKNLQLYGIYKPDSGQIIPHPEYVFFKEKTEKLKQEVITSLLVPEEGMWEDKELLMGKQAEITREIEWRRQDLAGMHHDRDKHKITDTQRRLSALQSELARITAFMNAAQLVKGEVVYSPPHLAESGQVCPQDNFVLSKDEEYPLDFAGNNFLIYRTKYLIAKFS